MKERRVVDTWAIALNEDNAKIIQIDNEDVWGELLTILQGGAPSSHDGRMGGPIYHPDKPVFKTHHYHPPHGHHTLCDSHSVGSPNGYMWGTSWKGRSAPIHDVSRYLQSLQRSPRSLRRRKNVFFSFQWFLGLSLLQSFSFGINFILCHIVHNLILTEDTSASHASGRKHCS